MFVGTSGDTKKLRFKIDRLQEKLTNNVLMQKNYIVKYLNRLDYF
jgi:hypothetical protein